MDDALTERLLAEINRNHIETRETLFKHFIVFHERIKKRVFWNPAYVIRKALDMMRIHDHQSSLFEQFKGFNNPTWLDSSFYTEKPLDQALNLLEYACTLDNKSWISRNVLGFMTLVKKSPSIRYTDQAAEAGEVMQEFANYLVEGHTLLQTISIPQLEHQLVNLVSMNMTRPESDLSIQLMEAIRIHEILANKTKDNLEILEKAASSGQMVRISNVLVIDKLFIDEGEESKVDQAGKYFNLSNLDSQTLTSLKGTKISNIKDTILKPLANELSASGVIAFDIEAYDLKEDSDWLGTIVSAVLGVVQVTYLLLYL